MKKYILPVEMLRKECNLENFNFTSTEEIHPLEGLIGQERAKKALEFGYR